MLPLIILLNCQQATILINRVKAHNLPPQYESALIQEIRSVSPKNCNQRT